MNLLISVIILVCINGLYGADIVIQGNTHVRHGDSLSLTCNGTGLQFPPANLDWFKDGSKLSPDGRTSISVYTKTIDQSTRTISSTLTIKNMDNQDEGQYKCWIANDLNAHVTVHVSTNVGSGADRMFLVVPLATLILALFV